MYIFDKQVFNRQKVQKVNENKLKYLLKYLSWFCLFSGAIFFQLDCSSPLSVDVAFRGDSPIFFSRTSISLTEGDTSNFTLSLTKKPTSNVTFDFAVSDAAQATILPTQLTFSPGSYDLPQSIQVYGIPDCLPDGTANISINITAITTSDSTYSSATRPSIPLTVNDGVDNLPRIVFKQSSTLNTSELGTIDSFKVNLSCQPTAGTTVTVPLVNSQPGEVRLDHTSLVFTDVSWSAYQTVTATGLPDCVLDGNKSYTISSGDVTTSPVDSRFDRYGNAFGAGQIHSSVSGINYDYASASDTVVNIYSNSLDMTLNFTAGHPDEFISFSVSLSCPPPSPVFFSFSFTKFTADNNDFAMVLNTSNGLGYFSFDSTNYNSPQSVLIGLQTQAVPPTMTNLQYINDFQVLHPTAPFTDNTNYQFIMYQSQGDAAQTAVVSPAYVDKTYTANITVNSY